MTPQHLAKYIAHDKDDSNTKDLSQQMKLEIHKLH